MASFDVNLNPFRFSLLVPSSLVVFWSIVRHAKLDFGHSLCEQPSRCFDPQPMIEIQLKVSGQSVLDMPLGQNRGTETDMFNWA